MRNKFNGFYYVFLVVLFLICGCAKDQVKPDGGIAEIKPLPVEAAASQTDLQQQAAAQKAAQELAAQRAAQELAAQKAAQELAAQKAAQEQAAAQQALKSDASVSAETAQSSLQTIYFAYDSYLLNQQSRDILYSNAEFMLKRYRGKIKLEGHSDERGSDEYNLVLAENRAKAALAYLLTLGVPAEQVSIISYGKERPIDTGHNEEAWAKNRRVEFTLVK